MGISRYAIQLRTIAQEIATPLRARNDVLIFGWSFYFTWGNPISRSAGIRKFEGVLCILNSPFPFRIFPGFFHETTAKIQQNL